MTDVLNDESHALSSAKSDVRSTMRPVPIAPAWSPWTKSGRRPGCRRQAGTRSS